MPIPTSLKLQSFVPRGWGLISRLASEHRGPGRHRRSGRQHARGSTGVFLCQALVAEASIGPAAGSPAGPSAEPQQQKASCPDGHVFARPRRSGDSHHLLLVCHALRARAHSRRTWPAGRLPIRRLDIVPGELGTALGGLPFNIRQMPLRRSVGLAASPRPVAVAAPLHLDLWQPLDLLAAPKRCGGLRPTRAVHKGGPALFTLRRALASPASCVARGAPPSRGLLVTEDSGVFARAHARQVTR